MKKRDTVELDNNKPFGGDGSAAFEAKDPQIANVQNLPNDHSAAVAVFIFNPDIKDIKPLLK